MYWTKEGLVTSRAEREGTRSHYTIQNSTRLKTNELPISGIFDSVLFGLRLTVGN